MLIMLNFIYLHRLLIYLFILNHLIMENFNFEFPLFGGVFSVEVKNQDDLRPFEQLKVALDNLISVLPHRKREIEDFIFCGIREIKVIQDDKKSKDC